MESQRKHCKTAFKTEKCGRPLTTDQMGGTTLINQSLSGLIKPLKYWITFNTPMKIKERTGFKKSISHKFPKSRFHQCPELQQEHFLR